MKAEITTMRVQEFKKIDEAKLPVKLLDLHLDYFEFKEYFDKKFPAKEFIKHFLIYQQEDMLFLHYSVQSIIKKGSW